MRTAVHPLHWHYRVDHLEVLNMKRLRQQWYMDNLVSKTILINGNTSAWDVGIPSNFGADFDPELTGKHQEFQKEARQFRIKMSFSEVEQKNQNHRAELEIRELKHEWKSKMAQKKAPKQVYDYDLVHSA
eukprot:15331366-Ditylum_brightwellii.AAC.1